MGTGIGALIGLGRSRGGRRGRPTDPTSRLEQSQPYEVSEVGAIRQGVTTLRRIDVIPPDPTGARD